MLHNVERIPYKMSAQCQDAHVQGRCGQWDPLPKGHWHCHKCVVPSDKGVSLTWLLLTKQVWFAQYLLPLSRFKRD